MFQIDKRKLDNITAELRITMNFQRSIKFTHQARTEQRMGAATPKSTKNAKQETEAEAKKKNQAKLGQNSRTPNAETSPNITNQQVSSSRAKYRARKEERDPAMAAERADRHLECGLERLIHCNKTKRISANKNNLGER
jgi:hypothetical protein